MNMKPTGRIARQQEQVTRGVIGILSIFHFVFNIVDFIYQRIKFPENSIDLLDWFMLLTFIGALIGGILFLLGFDWNLIIINLCVFFDFLLIAWTDIGIKIVSHIAIFTFSAQFFRYLQKKKQDDAKKRTFKKESLTLD